MKSLQEYFDNNFDIYYSGSDVTVFIGNVLVDEASMIGWNKINTASPSFAYNKELFTTVLHGKYHIEGKIAVNFTTPGYLEYIIMKASIDPQRQLGLTTYQKNKVNSILEMQMEKYKYYFYTYRRKTDTPPTDKIKDALRNYLWGHTSEKIDDIDVYRMVRDRYFNIIIIFGNPVSEDYAIRTIVDAKLVGDSIEIAPDGTPVQLIYSFVARKEDAPITPKIRSGYRPDISTKAYLHNIEEYIHDLGSNIISNNIIKTIQDSSIYLPTKTKSIMGKQKSIYDDFPYWYNSPKLLKLRINANKGSLFTHDELISRLLSSDILFNESGTIDVINKSIKTILATSDIDSNKSISIDNLKPLTINNIINIYQYQIDTNNDYIDFDILVNYPKLTYENNDDVKFINNNTKDDTSKILSLTQTNIKNNLILKTLNPINMKIPDVYKTNLYGGMRYAILLNDPSISDDFYNINMDYYSNTKISNIFYDSYYPLDINKSIVIPNIMHRHIAVFQIDFDKFFKSLRSYVEVLFKEVYYSDGLYLTGDNINDVGTKQTKTSLGEIPAERAPIIKHPDMDDILNIFFTTDDFIDMVDDNFSYNTNVFGSPLDNILKLRQVYIDNINILKTDYDTIVDREELVDSNIGAGNQLRLYELYRKSIDNTRNKRFGEIQNIDTYHLMQIDIKDEIIENNAGKNTITDFKINIEKKINDTNIKIDNIIELDNNKITIESTNNNKLLNFTYDDKYVYFTFMIPPIIYNTSSGEDNTNKPQYTDYHPFYNALFMKYDSNMNKYDMVRHNMLQASKSAVILNGMELNIKLTASNPNDEENIDSDWLEIDPKDINIILYFNSPYGINKLMGYNLNNINKYMSDIKKYSDALSSNSSYFINNYKIKNDYILHVSNNLVQNQAKFNEILKLSCILLGECNNAAISYDNNIIKYYVGLDLSNTIDKENAFSKINKSIESLIDELTLLKNKASTILNNNDNITKLSDYINNIIQYKDKINNINNELLELYKQNTSLYNTDITDKYIDIVGRNNNYVFVINNLIQQIYELSKLQDEIYDLCNILSNDIFKKMEEDGKLRITADDTRSIAPIPIITMKILKDNIDDVDKLVTYIDSIVNNKNLQLPKGNNINDILVNIWNVIIDTVNNIADNIIPKVVYEKGILDPASNIIDTKNIKDRRLGYYWIFKSNGTISIDGKQYDVKGDVVEISNPESLKSYNILTDSVRNISNVDLSSDDQRITLDSMFDSIDVGSAILINHEDIQYVYLVDNIDNNSIIIKKTNNIVSSAISSGDKVYLLTDNSNIIKEKVVIGDILYFNGKEFKIYNAFDDFKKCIDDINSGIYCSFYSTKENILNRIKDDIYKLNIQKSDTDNKYVNDYNVNIDVDLKFKDNHNKLVVYSLYNTKLDNEMYIINNGKKNKEKPKIKHNILAQYKIDPTPTSNQGVIYIPIVNYDNNGEFHVIDISSLGNALYTIDDINVLSNVLDSDTSLDYNILQNMNEDSSSLIDNGTILGQILSQYMSNNTIRQLSLYEIENNIVKKIEDNNGPDYDIFKKHLDFTISDIIKDYEDKYKFKIYDDYSKYISIVGLVHNGIDTTITPTRMGGWFISYSLKYIDISKELTRSINTNNNKNVGFGIYFTDDESDITNKWIHPSFHVVINIETAIEKLNNRFHIERDAGITIDRQRKKFKEGIIDGISKIDDSRISIEVEHTDGVLFTSNKMVDLRCKLLI